MFTIVVPVLIVAKAKKPTCTQPRYRRLAKNLRHIPQLLGTPRSILAFESTRSTNRNLTQPREQTAGCYRYYHRR